MRLVPVGEVELVDAGAAFLDLHAVVADVAERADADIELRAVRARQQAARPVAAGLEAGELAPRRTRRLAPARVEGEGHTPSVLPT